MRLIDADAFDERIRVAGGMAEEELTDDFKDGVLTTLKMLKTQPTVTQWIPCSERLPKQQETVLIQDFDNITIGYLNGENRWRDLTNLDDYLKGVIAWQPLSSPYKETK